MVGKKDAIPQKINTILDQAIILRNQAAKADHLAKRIEIIGVIGSERRRFYVNE